MDPRPDHGEASYRGSGRLDGKVALITGGDSGIGRAVAIAFAREGANVLISYLDEHDDARETAAWVTKAGRRVVTIASDISVEDHCRDLVAQAMRPLGRLDILVNNAAYQMTHESLEEIFAEEWDRTFRINIHSQFYLSKAAVPHMRPGSAIVNTASINSKSPSPTLRPYATTKGAIANFTAVLAQLPAEKGVRVDCVAPGPVWTPLIPSTMSPEKVEHFGENTQLSRAEQPAELAPAYVLLASQELADRIQELFARQTPWHVPWAQRTSPMVRRLIRHRPEHAIVTRFLAPGHPDDLPGSWRRYYPVGGDDARDAGFRLLELVPMLAEFVPPAQVFDKHGYSAFTAPGLGERLRAGGIDTLKLSGGETDICVPATVLGAVDRGYRLVLAEDAVCKHLRHHP
jgi:NAD(P)-dependent dehydrogenase (short-subunit alcohol dehydrogenase family)/nicotinamidase-related amidase